MLVVFLCAGLAIQAAPRRVRATGTIQAVHSLTVQSPEISGQGGELTLTKLTSNGVQVHVGDILAEFDRVQQLDAARDAKAKYDDLTMQIAQKVAQNQSDAEKRAADLKQAEADLAKAALEIRKAPILSEIDSLKNQMRLEDARAHAASLKRSNQFHEAAEAAALKILELQRDRQKVGLERANSNAELLVLRAPLNGMVAVENVWRNNSMGHAQEGDRIYGGQALLRIFDPSEMEVQLLAGEPDVAALVPGSRAVVRLDAYPDLSFDAHFESAGPVASSALGSPIKTFPARFRLEKSDPHLLPDLSAAVDIEVGER